MSTLVGALPNSFGPSFRATQVPVDVKSFHLPSANDLSINASPFSEKMVHVPVDINRFKQYAQVAPAALLSPKYPRSPALGSVLKTPADNTATSLRESGSSYIPDEITSDLPRVPQRQQLLGYGTVVQGDSPKAVSLESRMNDLMNILPPAKPVRKLATEQPVLPDSSPEASPILDRVEIAKRKADYRVKFSILRDAYPQMDIPEPADDQSVEEIEAMYRQYVKRIHVDSSVEQNKTYLMVLWLVIELVGSRYLKLPIVGYTVSQEKYMNKYRMLLIELGERSYASNLGDAWPVEVRILAMALMNGVIFLAVQLIAKKLGGDGNSAMGEKLAKMVNDFLTQNKGDDVLRRAEEATSDMPPPPATTTDDSNPFGMLGSFLPAITSMLGGGGGAAKTTEAPQMRRPTTFGARNRGVANTPEV